MIKNKTYNISDKLNKKIAILSDIHYQKFFKQKKFSDIYENLKKNKPDYICVLGDIIHDTSVVDSKINQNRLNAFFKYLGSIATTIVIIGNHDQIRMYKENEVDYNESFFEGLNKIDNVYYLNNKNYTDEKINFIGMNVDIKFYDKKEKIDILEENIKKIKIEKNKYNVLLFHSPQSITKLKYNYPLNKINLVLSGHMHGGIVFFPFDKIKGNRGLIGPYKNLFPYNARGLIKYNDTNIVVSSGITKVASLHSKFINEIFKKIPSQIEYINI